MLGASAASTCIPARTAAILHLLRYPPKVELPIKPASHIVRRDLVLKRAWMDHVDNRRRNHPRVGSDAADERLDPTNRALNVRVEEDDNGRGARGRWVRYV